MNEILSGPTPTYFTTEDHFNGCMGREVSGERGYVRWTAHDQSDDAFLELNFEYTYYIDSFLYTPAQRETQAKIPQTSNHS